jgi:hypothetical protein
LSPRVKRGPVDDPRAQAAGVGTAAGRQGTQHAIVDAVRVAKDLAGPARSRAAGDRTKMI